jgi:beta-glucosidase-like glycosyl hydrolase
MLDLNRRLYQLIISRLDGDRLSSDLYRAYAVELVRKGIGGFILFGGSKDEVRGFIDKLQSISKIPLLIASDIERGAGQQIKGATDFPCQMAVAAAIDKTGNNNGLILEKMVKAMADEAADIGINMPLIPVMDVNQNPDNPIICTRAFSDNPEDVAWYGGKYIKTLEDEGLISCAKHFPGHGDTAVDSHISLPVIAKSVRELTEVDVFPFKESISAGVSSIMIGHLSIPEIDPLPASLSKNIITGLLRLELGFEGLVLTDALNMHALNEFENVPARCIDAGADIILHPADADSAAEKLRSGIASGEVDEAKIDAAVKRIMEFKSKMKYIQKPEVIYSMHAEISAEIFNKSITCVKDAPDVLPIRDSQNISLVFTGDEHEFDITPLKKIVSDKDNIINVKELDMKKTSLKEAVVISLFTNVAAWKGSSGIRDEEIDAVNKLIGTSRKIIVISFGSPYVLRHFTKADVLIAAYDSTEQAQRAVIECLKGDKDFQGRLPVRNLIL